MQLIKFRVTDFRSVKDSSWIDTDNVTSLIGTNESGKTNLLVPLWKLNPAKEGEINPILDYPRDRYNEIRSLDDKPEFIHAMLELNSTDKIHLSSITDFPGKAFNSIVVHKDFDGNMRYEFPDLVLKREIKNKVLLDLIEKHKNKITSTEAAKSEEKLKEDMINKIDEKIKEIDINDETKKQKLEEIINYLKSIDLDKSTKSSLIRPTYEKFLEEIQEIHRRINLEDPAKNDDVGEYLLKELPRFVYYSNYGNLDSEIYLPHVIQNLERTDLGNKEEAKSRTLKVLFEFVRLSPQEIQDLGNDLINGSPPSNQQQIDRVSQNKKERDILLQSASTELTHKFREWWKQGEYRFRFQADGDHFRIWVSDDKRPEDIELESRSSGLQWFLSFYLIFLVESQDEHYNSILLLDEPGLSLHPLAQKDLSLFFDNLSKTNQLIYTTHSPFLVDTDRLDRVKAVFINENGLTTVSADLRASQPKSQQAKSVFPVHAALGLSISDTLFHGCIPVIVEGPSDQNYLTAIKNWLINKDFIKPGTEILFVPAGGVKGIKAVIPLITASNESLPYIVIDSDTQGVGLFDNLSKNIYSNDIDKLLTIKNITGKENSEVEDLWPIDNISKVVDRIYRGEEKDFSEVVDSNKPIISQIEKFASDNGIILEQPGWKVELSKAVKVKLISSPDLIDNESTEVKWWKDLFDKILS